MSATPTPAPSGSSQPASSSSLSIPQSAPAGLITITQPPQTATSYYKIAPGEVITFGWNFTMLLSTPTHLTVSAICDNGNTYPVGPTDGIIPGSATSVTWDLWSYNQANPTQPLAQTGYQLNIWDERGPGAPISPGKLRANNELRFALYSTQAYTPLASGEFSIIDPYFPCSIPAVQAGNARGVTSILLGHHPLQTPHLSASSLPSWSCYFRVMLSCDMRSVRLVHWICSLLS